MALKSVNKKFYKKEQVWILKETGSARTDKRKNVVFLFNDGVSAEIQFDYDYFIENHGCLGKRFLGKGATERVDLENASYSKSVVEFFER